MPDQGRVVEREYTAAERTVLNNAILTLGAAAIDVYLNDRAYWRNVPAAVWNYQLGAYQVLNKWLSCRESKVRAARYCPKRCSTPLTPPGGSARPSSCKPRQLAARWLLWFVSL